MIPTIHNFFTLGFARARTLSASLLMAGLLAVPSAIAQDDDGGLAGAPDEPDHGSEAEAATRYVDLQPEFVLNYGDPEDRLRFLRMEVTLLMRDGEAAAEANHHAPSLRHIVVMNVSRAQRSDLNTSDGRQALRQQLHDDMQAMLRRETDENLLREVLFSNLILQ